MPKIATLPIMTPSLPVEFEHTFGRVTPYVTPILGAGSFGGIYISPQNPEGYVIKRSACPSKEGLPGFWNELVVSQTLQQKNSPHQYAAPMAWSVSLHCSSSYQQMLTAFDAAQAGTLQTLLPFREISKHIDAVVLAIPRYSGSFDQLFSKKIHVSETNFAQASLTFLKSLQHLHEQGFLHCDLHAGNIFYRHEPNKIFELVLGDFGLSEPSHCKDLQTEEVKQVCNHLYHYAIIQNMKHLASVFHPASFHSITELMVQLEHFKLSISDR